MTIAQAEINKQFLESVYAIPHGGKIRTCTQCGTCSASCPSSAAMEYGPREIIAALRAGMLDRVLNSHTVWLCVSCYGRLKNVLDSLDFERISHAGGPTGGEILTADGKMPEQVAIIHWVGSRDENYHEYCSRVCCMYSLKFAHLVKEKTGAEVYNFYIDMRTPGKGYEEFYKRLLAEGVHFVRGKCAEITDVAETPDEEGKLVVVGEDTLLGITRRVPVDMVILRGRVRAVANGQGKGRARADHFRNRR